MGVDLFFVLSGFLITGILFNQKNRQFGQYIRHFYSRRARRIFPAYVAALIVSGILFGFSFLRQWYMLFGLMNFQVMTTLPGGPTELPLWSLAVEEQFYFVWPLIIFVLGRSRLISCTAILVLLPPPLRYVCTLLFADHLPIYHLLPFRMDTLAAGALIALLWPEIRERLDAAAGHSQEWVHLRSKADLVLSWFCTITHQDDHQHAAGKRCAVQSHSHNHVGGIAAGVDRCGQAGSVVMAACVPWKNQFLTLPDSPDSTSPSTTPQSLDRVGSVTVVLYNDVVFRREAHHYARPKDERKFSYPARKRCRRRTVFSPSLFQGIAVQHRSRSRRRLQGKWAARNRCNQADPLRNGFWLECFVYDSRSRLIEHKCDDESNHGHSGRIYHQSIAAGEHRPFRGSDLQQ